MRLPREALFAGLLLCTISLRMSSSPSIPTTSAASTGKRFVMVEPLKAWLLGLALLAVFIAGFWAFFVAQWRMSIEEPSDWGHTFVIPFISGYLVWLRREQILAVAFRPCWPAASVVLIGILGYALATFGPSWFAQHHNARGCSVGLTLIGLCWFILGTRATKYMIFAICYWIFFGQKISDGILRPVTERMQDWSSIGAYWSFVLMGTDIERSGNVLTIWRGGEAQALNVAEACSGMRMLVAFLALGVVIAYTSLSSFWQRALLVAAGFPVSLGVNVLRVVTLGILGWFDVNFTTGEFHSFIGLVWLVPALALYLGVLWLIRNLFVDSDEDASDAEASPDAH